MSLFCWTQRKIFWRMWETEQFWGTIDFHSIYFPSIEVNGAPKQPGYKLSSKYFPLCSAEQRHSYRFGITWGWVNDDRIFIFGWTIPLMPSLHCVIFKVVGSHCFHTARLSWVACSCCGVHIARWTSDRKLHAAWLYNKKNRRQLCLVHKLRFTTKRTQEVIRK